LLFFTITFKHKKYWYKAAVVAEDNVFFKGQITERYFVLVQMISGTWFMKIERDHEGNWELPESEGIISYELLYKIGAAIDKVEGKK
jgi:hypothetical protein